MPDEEPQNQEESLEDVFASFREAWYAGKYPDVETFLESYSQYGEELRERIENFLMVAGTFPDPGEGEDNEASNNDNNESGFKILGDFRVLNEIGRGGMGVVYEAEQLSLERRVALKVLPFAAILDERQLRRFKNEARASAMLKHPNIVNVYSVGCKPLPGRLRPQVETT